SREDRRGPAVRAGTRGLPEDERAGFGARQVRCVHARASPWHELPQQGGPGGRRALPLGGMAVPHAGTLGIPLRRRYRAPDAQRANRVTRFFLGVLALIFSAGAGAQLLDFPDAEKRAILRHGPWPAPWTPDPTNRASGNPEAIALGERLFFEPRLSPSGKVLCATCHAPFRGWQDARPRAFGHADADRNTQSLYNVRYNRWFGWDGAGESLWAQSIRPMLDAREMGGSQAHAAALVRGDAELSCRFEKTFGAP